MWKKINRIRKRCLWFICLLINSSAGSRWVGEFAHRCAWRVKDFDIRFFSASIKFFFCLRKLRKIDKSFYKFRSFIYACLRVRRFSFFISLERFKHFYRSARVWFVLRNAIKFERNWTSIIANTSYDTSQRGDGDKTLEVTRRRLLGLVERF